MFHLIEHTLVDCSKILPFLFIAFLFIELLEHRFSNKTKKMVFKSGKLGPLVGSFLGVFPQCGFSVLATNLYITRVISIGTLISIYLSTSDEMLPIMLSRNVDIKIILSFLLVKIICGIVFGFIIDFMIKNKKREHSFEYQICEDNHCDCNHGIIKSSIKHTLNTLIFLIVITFGLNLLFEYTTESFLSKIFMKGNIFSPFLGSLIGLIPNCGSSIMLTELFLNNLINFGTCISGLLTGSGVALLVLFKTNKNFKENITIVSILYLIGVLVGIFIEFMGIVL